MLPIIILLKSKDMIMENPILQFIEWWDKSQEASPLKHNDAVCLSTINDHGYPSGRIVDLKAADENGFVFCTYLESAKALELLSNSNVAITVWWDHVGYQVRVLGEAKLIDESLAQKLWSERDKASQIATISFEQSKPINTLEEIQEKYVKSERCFEHIDPPKPDKWGGFVVVPSSIEFFQFNENRMHKREHYTLHNDKWGKTILQP
jgi:pyridoxamine 5'-phosphate oxidase